jgi:hypothetical protein
MEFKDRGSREEETTLKGKRVTNETPREGKG